MGRRSQALPLALLLLAAAGLLLHALQYTFVSDDAYISFRYAHNLAYHGELTFNLGERVEGYTNFLWTVLLGGLLKAGLRPDVMSRILGALFGACVLVLCYVWTRVYRGGKPTAWDSLAALMLAACAGFAVWCSGGLETQLFTALAMGGVTLYLAEEAGRTRWRLSGALFALAALTRPEGLMLFGLTGLHRLLANLVGERRLRPRWAEIGWVLGFVLPFGLHLLWRLSYYGFPFPNTYYIKAGGGAAASAVKWGLPYLWDFVRDNKLYVLPALLPFFRPRTAWRREGPQPGERRVPRPAFVWSYSALLALAFAGYVVMVGGDFMALGRFLAPILPLVALFAQEGLRELAERPRRDRAPDEWRLSRVAPTAVLLVGLGGWNSVGLYRDSQKLSYYRWGLDTVAYLDRFAADRVIVGNWMRQSFPPQTTLAVGGAGAIVYASRMRALDTYGLNDSWIAHHTPPVGDRPGHTKTAPEHYLLEKRPDLMCHQAHHQDVPYQPPPFEEQYWRQRGYGWVCLAPPGLKPAYYCCLKRLDRALGPFPAEVGS